MTGPYKRFDELGFTPGDIVRCTSYNGTYSPGRFNDDIKAAYGWVDYEFLPVMLQAHKGIGRACLYYKEHHYDGQYGSWEKVSKEEEAPKSLRVNLTELLVTEADFQLKDLIMIHELMDIIRYLEDPEKDKFETPYGKSRNLSAAYTMLEYHMTHDEFTNYCEERRVALEEIK